MFRRSKHKLDRDEDHLESQTSELQAKQPKVQEPLDLSQAPLLDKLNLYLKQLGRKNHDGTDYQIATEGYCHGLTLLFLEKKAEGNIQWFYDIKRKIIECQMHELEEMELEIEKFLAMIEWAQNTSKYTQEQIFYFNIDLILETQSQKSFEKAYTFTQLKDFLASNYEKGTMICLTSCDDKARKHSIGIFTDGYFFHLFDANYHSGQATRFCSPVNLTKEVYSRLYTYFDEQLPEKAQLEIIVVHRPGAKIKLHLPTKNVAFFKEVSQSEIKMPKQEEPEVDPWGDFGFQFPCMLL